MTTSATTYKEEGESIRNQNPKKETQEPNQENEIIDKNKNKNENINEEVKNLPFKLKIWSSWFTIETHQIATKSPWIATIMRMTMADWWWQAGAHLCPTPSMGMAMMGMVGSSKRKVG